MGKKKGKKSREPKEEQAAGGQPVKESAQKVEGISKELTGPSLPQQQKKDVEPTLQSGGGDTAADPSKQPQGERSGTAGPSKQPQGEKSGTAGPSKKSQGERSDTTGPAKQPQGERSGTTEPSKQPQGEKSGTAGPSKQPQGEKSGTAGPSKQPQGERSGTAGPSKQPQGERSGTAGPSKQPQGDRSGTTEPSKQPQGEKSGTAGPSQQQKGGKRKQRQSQKQPAHIAGKEGQKKGQAGTEHVPGVPPQSVSQAPQTTMQRERPPEGTPAQPPPPAVHVLSEQLQHLVISAGHPPGSFMAPGAMGPRGITPPFQTQSSSHAPSEHVPGVPPQSVSQAPQKVVQRERPPEGTPPYTAIPPTASLPSPPPPGVQGPWGQPQQLGIPAGYPPGSLLAPGAIGPRGMTPPHQAPPPGAVGPRGMTPPRQAPAPGAVGPRGSTPPSQTQSTSPAPSGTVKKTESAGVATTSKGTALQIPKRKGCGTKGRKIVVETNYLPLDLSKLRNSIAYHYDVEFEPEKLPKRLLKYAMEEFRRKNFPSRYPAFDGRKNLYTSQELPEITDTVNVNDEESEKVKEVKVTIKYATEIDMRSLVAYMQSGSSVVPPQNAVQALDVVLRSARMSRGFVQVGRSFFSPQDGHVLDLGGGLEMWHGVFQSAVLGWKPFLNIDVAHKGFPKEQDVLSAINDICGRPRAGEELDYRQEREFQEFIRGLKVQYMIPNNPSSKRIYKVNKIGESSAKLRFDLENGQSITVQDYFSRFKGVRLQYPHLPCLHVGSLTRKNPIHLPPELCRVTGSQVINKKMNEKQTSAMIKSAATSTDVRKRKIMDALREVRLNADPCIREFGITIGDRFEEVDARILDPPQLEYNKKIVPPSGGKWWASNFYAGGNLGAWMILNLDGYVREDELRYFGEEMQKIGRTLGMSIPPPSTQTLPKPRPDKLEETFRRMKSNNFGLVVVVIPDKDTYAKVKQLAELKVGLLTQCILSATIRNMKPATCSNILLKVNSKLNGINHIIAGVSKPRCLHSPTMIVGADVTHPPPGILKPSVAAVCASNDPRAFSYNIQIRLQPPRLEIIQDMDAIIKAQLLYFYKSTRGQKPERIIFYRDGVGEGHFNEVLRSEVGAIRRACASLQQGYEPSVTFLVVQKRHHTRFFPVSDRDADGRNRNVPAGTIVDTKITHPTDLDFFLASHASIQGVTRPTKYRMLWNDDDNMTTDEIEQLTYYLCHLFSRCTRSVSYPAPTYNAHLAAYRAGVYLEGTDVNLENLPNEQRKYFESEVLKRIIAENPMYFV